MAKREQSYQRGDVMTVVVVILVVALVGALGFIAWQNFSKKDDVVVEQQSAMSEADAEDKPTAEVPAGWVQATDSATGISYATPKAWLSESCDERCKVEVEERAIDEIFHPMMGPTWSVRYVSAENQWQTINPLDESIVTDGTVVVLSEKAEGKYAAAQFTGGDGPTAQTHIFVVKGQRIYQFALPVTVANGPMQDEKIAEAGAFVKTIRFADN